MPFKKGVNQLNCYGERQSFFDARAQVGKYFSQYVKLRDRYQDENQKSHPEWEALHCLRDARLHAMAHFPPDGVAAPKGVNCLRVADYWTTPIKGADDTRAEKDSETGVESGGDNGRREAPPDPVPVDVSPKQGGRWPKKEEGTAVRLFRREEFNAANEKTSPRKVLEWVIDNVCIEDATPHDAPTPGAWTRLVLARRSYDALGDLMKAWDRLLPSRSEQAKNEGRTDDGRELTEMVDLVINARRKAKDRLEHPDDEAEIS